MACRMHTLVVPSYEPLLRMLQRLGADLLTPLLSLGRTPEPSRVPQPVRPDTPPPRPHIPSRQPYPTRQD